MIIGYFDESYKESRVYAIGGYIARTRDWEKVSRKWKNRRLRDGVQCFHAAECESGHSRNFSHLSKEQRVCLKADLIELVNENENLGGFGAAVIMEDFYRVRDSSERARAVLGPEPYFLCFQMVLSGICKEFEAHDAGPGMKTALVFEQQDEVSGRAMGLYDRFKRLNSSYAPRLGTLTYASRTRCVPLEMADNLAYETMKEILNRRYDPARPRRKAMERMISRIRSIVLMTAKELQELALLGRVGSDYSQGRR